MPTASDVRVSRQESVSIRVNNGRPINNFISARKIMIAGARAMSSWFHISRRVVFCFSAMLPEKSALEPRLSAAGSLTEIYDKLAQRACSMRIIQTHTCTGKVSLMRKRAPARRFFSYSRQYDAFRSFTKYHTAPVIYEIAYPITLNILGARLYDC